MVLKEYVCVSPQLRVQKEGTKVVLKTLRFSLNFIANSYIDNYRSHITLFITIPYISISHHLFFSFFSPSTNSEEPLSSVGVFLIPHFQGLITLAGPELLQRGENKSRAYVWGYMCVVVLGNYGLATLRGVELCASYFASNTETIKSNYAVLKHIRGSACTTLLYPRSYFTERESGREYRE